MLVIQKLNKILFFILEYDNLFHLASSYSIKPAFTWKLTFFLLCGVQIGFEMCGGGGTEGVTVGGGTVQPPAVPVLPFSYYSHWKE